MVVLEFQLVYKNGYKSDFIADIKQDELEEYTNGILEIINTTSEVMRDSNITGSVRFNTVEGFVIVNCSELQQFKIKGLEQLGI